MVEIAQANLQISSAQRGRSAQTGPGDHRLPSILIRSLPGLVFPICQMPRATWLAYTSATLSELGTPEFIWTIHFMQFARPAMP